MLPNFREFILVAFGKLDQFLKDTIRHRLLDGRENRALLDCFT